MRVRAGKVVSDCRGMAVISALHNASHDSTKAAALRHDSSDSNTSGSAAYKCYWQKHALPEWGAIHLEHALLTGVYIRPQGTDIKSHHVTHAVPPQHSPPQHSAAHSRKSAS